MNEINKQFYKYRSIKEPSDFSYTLDFVNNRNFWFKNSNEMNDPCDIDVGIFPDEEADRIVEKMKKELRYKYTPKEQLRKKAQDALESGDFDAHKNAIDAANAFRKLFYLFCASRSDDIISQWAYYASDHTGVCIGFELDRNLDFVGDNPNYSLVQLTGRELAFDVIYDSTPSYIRRGKPSDTDLKIFEKKAPCWDHENETRWLLQNLSSAVPLGYLIKMPPDIIKSVTFGLRCTKEAISSFKSRVVDKNIKFYQMRKIPGRYTIKKFPI